MNNKEKKPELKAPPKQEENINIHLTIFDKIVINTISLILGILFGLIMFKVIIGLFRN